MPNKIKKANQVSAYWEEAWPINIWSDKIITQGIKPSKVLFKELKSKTIIPNKGRRLIKMGIIVETEPFKFQNIAINEGKNKG